MEAVKEHYNKAKQHSIQERKQLPTFPLQVANNRIKDYLIRGYLKPGRSILDMACGKGGDGRRILEQRPSHYAGFDISEASIQEAGARHGSQYFFVGDMTQPQTFQHKLIAKQCFDVINTQFCLHYVWPQFANVLKHVDPLTKSGSVWIGTLVDDQELGKFQNNVVAQIHRETPTSPSYKFSMPPSVNNCEEWVVPWQQFLTVMQDHGWRLVQTEAFRNLRSAAHISPDLRCIHYLYRYFIFRKS